ncbi:ankyrin repeat-containing domain protein, partial [Fusarium solani]
MGPPSIIQLAKNGDVEQLKEQLLGEVDLNLRDGLYGQTALSWASENGHLEVVKILLGKHAKIDIADGGGLLPLYWACSTNFGLLDAARRLVEDGSKVNALDGTDRSPLILASISGSLPTVKFLLDKGADLNLRDGTYKQTPLMFAVEYGREDVVQYLCTRDDAGANLYSSDHHGRTPVLHAAMSSIEMLKVCIEEPTGPGIADTEPIPRARAIEMGLRYACEVDSQDILDFILRSGKYLNAQDGHQRNVLSLASEHGNKTEMEKLCKKDLDFNLRDKNGRTPLSWAAADGGKECVSLLLERDAIPDRADNNRRTPLSWASGSGQAGGVALLLEKGAQNDSKDISKRTPLSWAAANGSKECVSLLLKEGADPDHPDNSRRTPLSWAAGEGHLLVVKHLLA